MKQTVILPKKFYYSDPYYKKKKKKSFFIYLFLGERVLRFNLRASYKLRKSSTTKKVHYIFHFSQKFVEFDRGVA